jgi:uncharacterized protein YndB with AHSA1/START domain
MTPLTAQKHVVIKAPPEVVWRIHTDVNDWSQWHQSISSARLVGPLAIGSHFVWKSGGLSIDSTVQSLEPERRMSWSGRSLGTHATHTWTFQRQSGGTLVTTEESMTGWLVSILRLFMPMFLDKSLEDWLQDLRKKAESINPKGHGSTTA